LNEEDILSSHSKLGTPVPKTTEGRKPRHCCQELLVGEAPPVKRLGRWAFEGPEFPEDLFDLIPFCLLPSPPFRPGSAATCCSNLRIFSSPFWINTPHLRRHCSLLHRSSRPFRWYIVLSIQCVEDLMQHIPTVPQHDALRSTATTEHEALYLSCPRNSRREFSLSDEVDILSSRPKPGEKKTRKTNRSSGTQKLEP
jgi:hypothetical protein